MNLYSTFPVGWRWVLLFVWKCFWFVSPLESWLVGHWWLGVVMDGSSLSTLFRYIVPPTHSLLLLFSNAAILSSVTLFFFFYFSLSFSSFYFPPVFHLIPFWLSRPLFFFSLLPPSHLSDLHCFSPRFIMIFAFLIFFNCLPFCLFF